MGLKRRPGTVSVLDLVEIRERIGSLDLPPSLHSLLKGAHLFDDGDWDDDDVGLWIDGPFDEVCRKVAPLPRRLAIAVFASPVDTKHSLVLRTIDLFGWRLERNGAIFLFVEPVCARDVCTAPEVLSLFAKGLTVERVACFDGGDSHAEVAGHIDAPYVFSNHRGSGGLTIARGTEVRIGEYARHIYELPKGVDTVKRDDIVDMWPGTNAEEIEDMDAWEYVRGRIDEGASIPP